MYHVSCGSIVRLDKVTLEGDLQVEGSNGTRLRWDKRATSFRRDMWTHVSNPPSLQQHYSGTVNRCTPKVSRPGDLFDEMDAV